MPGQLLTLNMKPEVQDREVVSVPPQPGVGRVAALAATGRDASRAGVTTVARPGRIVALDFTKGALVLIMVLYHWINYFVGADWPYYFYLRFLTPSFIFVSGFVVSNVYLTRTRAVDARLVGRLLTRGLKLLALFAVLNIVRSALLYKLSAAAGAAAPFGRKLLGEVFISGNVSTASGKLVAFYILVPISYLLLLSAVLLVPQRQFRYTFHVVCGIFLGSVVVLAVYGIRSYNLEYVTIGLTGVLIGLIPLEKINRAVSHPWVLGAAYGCYLAAITRWNVPFGLLVPGVALSVSIIYLVGLRGGERTWLQRHVIVLGKYSLFGYVAQIAILQLLSATLRHVHSEPLVIAISFVAAFVLTSAAVEVLDRMRRESQLCDRAYKAVFA
jgi:peptidoglycan/LPS O-acetylase OafA/YrhL